MRFTDMADELFGTAEGALPAGVRLATAKRGGVTVTRVEIAREGLSRPRGRYVTLEMPSVSVLDERDADVIETCAAELRALLPPEGPVLVLGVGSRRITADALGPRTVQKVLVTMGRSMRCRCAASGPWPPLRRGCRAAPGSPCASWPEQWWKRCGLQPSSAWIACAAPRVRVWAVASSFRTPGCTRHRQTTQGIWTPGCWACRWSRRASPP